MHRVRGDLPSGMAFQMGTGTHPIGQKKLNAFSLYDMPGNVVEWTHNWYTVQLSQENINPTGPSLAEFKSLRGGGWWDDPELVRASCRRHFEPDFADFNIGFGVPRTRKASKVYESFFIIRSNAF